jgi:site-specific recombinase XerD
VKHKHEDRLPRLTESFFRDYLQNTRGVSPRTVLSYRDGLRLLFLYLADNNGGSVGDLSLNDLKVDVILAFLSHLETDRGNAISTRNLRLCAIQSFFRHLLRHDPTRAEQYHRVLALPVKRDRPPLACYLEPEEARILIGKPDVTTAAGLRDRALLLFLYNTGARVSEPCAVRGQDLELFRPRQVRLRGKGGRERYCPLWKDTATALQRLRDHHALPPEGGVFRNARGGVLTRDGVAYILRKYVSQSLDDLPELRKREVTPHVLRHSCAVALLQAGADLTVIRDYLGHASVATTSRYVATNLQMKREVLEAFWRRAGIASPRTTPWHPRPDVMAFLNSL